jgi:hypothetical protein
LEEFSHRGDFLAGFGGGALEVGGVGDAQGLEFRALGGKDLRVDVVGVTAEEAAHN